MTFTERHGHDSPVLTSVGTWDLFTMLTVVTSADMVRVKNIMLTGIYNVDQTTEVNTQFGHMLVALFKFPDTVSTPDPGFDTGGTMSGLDRQIFKWRTIWSAGQNNPVLWSMKFRAINVKPGETLYLGTRALVESGTSINHRMHTGLRWWQDDG